MVRNQEDPDWYMQQLFVFYATVGGNWLVYIYRTILRIWAFWYLAGSLFVLRMLVGVGAWVISLRCVPPIYVSLNIAMFQALMFLRNDNV